MEKFRFGRKSLQELEGVHLGLVAMCHRALELSAVDFSVHDGLRTSEEQQALVAVGASETMNSKHLTGDAVDLVPYVNSMLRWEWGPIFKVAEAVRQAAQELKIPIVWGAAWDLNFTQTTDSPELIMQQYSNRIIAKGRKPFLDGPHYQRM